MSKNIQMEIERKTRFIKFLSNAIFLLEDAMNRNDEEDIVKYQTYAISVIEGIIGINSHGELKSKDTREEDVKLGELRTSVKKLGRDITDKYNALPSSIKPRRGWFK